jgi:hypothetical protein
MVDNSDKAKAERVKAIHAAPSKPERHKVLVGLAAQYSERMRLCSCGYMQPSASRGMMPGAAQSPDMCANCAYLECVHQPVNPRTGRADSHLTCGNYTPAPPAPLDDGYCGHSGWD